MSKDSFEFQEDPQQRHLQTQQVQPQRIQQERQHRGPARPFWIEFVLSDIRLYFAPLTAIANEFRRLIHMP